MTTMHHPSLEFGQNQGNGRFTIEFSLPGTRPPVFIAGTYTDPKWKLIEMKYKELQDSDDYQFWVELDLSKGQEYQYKFRVGENDWILNEEETTVIDTAGNRNNLLPANSNIDEWSEGSYADQGENIWEERRITKYVTEKRKKDIGMPLAKPTRSLQSQAVQNTPAPDASAANAPDKVKKVNEKAQNLGVLDKDSVEPPGLHIKNIPTRTNRLIPEFPSEPTPTPAFDTDHSPASIEIPVQNNISQKTLPTTGITKVDAQRSDHENVELNATRDLNAIQNVMPLQDANKQKSPNTDTSKTAAELADVDMINDDASSPPPISDTESGQDGLRHLSTTPTPQVARVAAEVADVAAELDKNSQIPVSSQQSSNETIGNELESGRATPPDERVPRFSYEVPYLSIQSQLHQNHPENLSDPIPVIDDHVPEKIDPGDPSIQHFPTEPAKILAKLAEIQQRLPEDETHFEGTLLSPVVMPDNWEFSGQVESNSPAPSNQQLLPPLQSISEEDNQSSGNSVEGSNKDTFGHFSSCEPENKGKEKINQPTKVMENNRNPQAIGCSSQENIESEHILSPSDNDVSSRNIEIEPLAQNINDRVQEKSNIKIDGRSNGTLGNEKYQSHFNSVNIAGPDSHTLNHKPSAPPINVCQLDGSSNEIGQDKPTEIKNDRASDSSSSLASSNEGSDVDSFKNQDSNGIARSTGIADNTAQEPSLRKPENQKIIQKSFKSPETSLPQNSNSSSGKSIQSRGFFSLLFEVLVFDLIGGYAKKFLSIFKRRA